MEPGDTLTLRRQGKNTGFDLNANLFEFAFFIEFAFFFEFAFLQLGRWSMACLIHRALSHGSDFQKLFFHFL